MNKLFYFRLAAQNLRKNGKFYIPYLLAGIGNVMMFYIMVYLRTNPAMENHESLGIVLGLGTVVIAIFSSVFIFYTNSFLMKRRKKEIGLFNILGMEKKHIACVLSAETLYTALISIGGGIGLGILFSKLFLLLMTKIMGYGVEFGFSVSAIGVASTAAVFCAIFFLTLLYNLGRIHLSKPVELLSSSSVGEKEPRVKWPIAFFGVVTLAAGYILALKIETPTTAFLMFFAAVILVIIGTYCLFCACSIAVLKMLRKNKGFYYKLKNFTTVSGMMYRMKQNAAGLAAICILSTMVLVTISTTVSLYMGRNDMVTSMYPREICSNSTAAENAPAVQDAFAQSTRALGLEIKNPIAGRSRSLNVISVDGSYEDAPASVSSGEVVAVSLVPLSDYNSTFGTNFQLASGEALAYPTGNFVLSDTVTLGGQAVHIAQRLDESPYIGSGNYTAITGLILVVPDEEATSLYRAMGGTQEQFAYSAAFDVDATPEQIAALQEDLWTRLNGICGIYARSELYTEWNAMYGSFLFLGIFLGCLFLMATVLIIYYKQISEGYEDHDRFRIMQQVGMSRREVRQTINSQVRMVFFLPLAVAALHILMAFSMIRKLLLLFSLTDVKLFALCTVGTLLIFSAIYALVYSFTAKTYYKIVRST